MSLLDFLTYCYESITPFQAAMALGIATLYVLYLFVRDMDVPPGPRGLLFFGYWPFLKTDNAHLHLTELSKKYGDVFSFRAVGNLFIHLGSAKTIREAHITKSDYFEARFTDTHVFTIAFGESLAFLKGEQWKVLRKFFLSEFKTHGVNAVKENAGPVYDAMKETVEELRQINGRPIPISDMVAMKCLQLMRRVMFNDRGLTNQDLQNVAELYGEMMKAATSTNLFLIGKFPKYFMFPFMPAIWKLKSCSKRILNIFSDLVIQCKSEYKESEVVHLIDSYFKERNDRRKKGDPTAEHFTDLALASSLLQMVADGALTIAVLIENIFLKLIERPEEQGKIYQEILEVIGTERFPTLEDKTKLPYTNAFLYEVVRYTDFFPMFTSMECTKETTVQGYKIPKGAITLIHFYAANRNPVDFENPNEFNPSRYLPSPGKKRPDLPQLFGVGKRACLGEGFSMIQAFLFLTTIVQNFRLTFPEGSETSTAKFWAKEKFLLCAHPRSQKAH